jgi:uncharacterized protein
MSKKVASSAAKPSNLEGAALSIREPSALPWLFADGKVTGDLLDINVWLALAVQEHPHHASARRYWESVQSASAPDRQLWFCRVTMLGLVHLLCQPKVVGEGALTLNAAFALYQRFRSVPGVGLLPDPASCEPVFQKLLTATALPPRFWTDAYLAALAQSSGARLVSFDSDFSRFGLLKCLILTPSYD